MAEGTTWRRLIEVAGATLIGICIGGAPTYLGGAQQEQQPTVTRLEIDAAIRAAVAGATKITPEQLETEKKEAAQSAETAANVRNLVSQNEQIIQANTDARLANAERFGKLEDAIKAVDDRIDSLQRQVDQLKGGGDG